MHGYVVDLDKTEYLFDSSSTQVTDCKLKSTSVEKISILLYQFP